MEYDSGKIAGLAQKNAYLPLKSNGIASIEFSYEVRRSMSTTTFPPPNSSPATQIFVHSIPSTRSDSRVIRRRPNMSQGQALEMIGHAIEYVYDSRVYRNNGQLSDSEMQAVQILMRLSREVFQECKEVTPVVNSEHRLGLTQRILNLLIGRWAA